MSNEAFQQNLHNLVEVEHTTPIQISNKHRKYMCISSLITASQEIKQCSLDNSGSIAGQLPFKGIKSIYEDLHLT